ncbi:MAG: ABC transporter substrate-binding protein [Nitrososphaerales archaeon]
MPQEKYLSIAVLSLLAAFSITAVFGLAVPGVFFNTSASSPSSCPASRTVTYVTQPIPQSFNFLNPSGISSFDIASLEYLSLAPFPLNPNGSLDWTVSLSNWMSSDSNYSQWTFHIRPGATWSNGTAVTASDVVTWASPSYALNPQYDFAGLHSEVVGVHAVNSDTVTFNLNVSDAQFPSRASLYYYAPVVSPTDVAKGPAAPLFGTGLADGPWYVANYTSGSTTGVMLPNPYWPGQKPSACVIDIIFVENSALEIPFLVSGQADLAGYLPYGDTPSLQGHSNLHISTTNPQLGTDMVYNITQYPYNMTEFRQALAYSINTSAIVQQSLFSYGVPSNNAQGEVPSTSPFYNSHEQQYPYNVTAAVNLLHSIGFTGGGGASTPLRFPNGTQMSLTIYTDSSKAWDPDIEKQVAGFITNLGINAQTQTLTTQNLGADYASNAFNIRNNLVIYSSGGPLYFSPWLDGQQGCNTMGTPGCYGWFAAASADGQTHWEYPPSADVEYQSNLTALDGAPPTNITGQAAYLSNIELLNAQYLPVIMLAYPDKLFAYNTAHWTSWSSYILSSTGLNVTMFNALQPAGGSTTSVTSTTSSTSMTSITGSVSTSTSGVTSTHSSITASTTATTATTSASSIGTIELIAGIVIVIIIIGGIAAYLMRRRP